LAVNLQAFFCGYCQSLDGATLFSKVISNKLPINVKNKVTLIYAKFEADTVNISKVAGRKTKWPRFISLYPVARVPTGGHISQQNTNGFFMQLICDNE